MSVRGQYLIAEAVDDLFQRGLSRLDQFTAQQVCVDHLGPKAGEMVAGGGLAAADTAGQPDPEQVQPSPASCR